MRANSWIEISERLTPCNYKTNLVLFNLLRERFSEFISINHNDSLNGLSISKMIF